MVFCLDVCAPNERFGKKLPRLVAAGTIGIDSLPNMTWPLAGSRLKTERGKSKAAGNNSGICVPGER
eukprot:1855484-Amphidinium_carterae.1